MSENRDNGKAEDLRVTEEPGRAADGGAEAGARTPGSGAGAPGPGGTARDPIGSVAEEAMKLFDALQDRVMREIGKGVVKGGARAGMSGLGQAFGRAEPRDVWSEAVAEAGQEEHDEYICRACPICRMKAAARESRGDVTDHLLAAGGELVAALRQALDALQRPAPSARSRERDREERTSRVERIDLD